jgi:FkbM family methyltransferase
MEFDLAVDVGANKGQFAAFARIYFPHARIVSIEPLAEACAICQAIFRNDPRVQIIPVAVGREHGELVMRVADKDDSSSPLDLGEAQTKIFGTGLKGVRHVPCAPLSQLIQEEDLAGRSLLKIDTQGFELEVLVSAGNLLEKFDAVYCEVSFVELYVGQPLAPEIISFLRGRGFALAGVFNLASAREIGPVQADMLFLGKRRF